MRRAMLSSILLAGCIESELSKHDEVVDTAHPSPEDTGTEVEDTGQGSSIGPPPTVALSTASGVVLDPKLDEAQIEQVAQQIGEILEAEL